MVEIQQRGGLTLALFPAAWLGVHVAPLGDGRYGPLQAADALASDAAIEAVLDGPMFGSCAGDRVSYSARACEDLHYLMRDAGVDDPGDYPTRGVTITINGSTVRWLQGAQAPEGTDVAVQLYPQLVSAGRNLSSRSIDAENTWRAAVVQMADGRVGFAVMIAPMYDFSAALIAAGAVEAGYTDGGGSTVLQTRSARWGSSENRRVASFLVAKPPSPSIVGSLVSTVAAVMFAMVLLVGAWFGWQWWRERKELPRG